MTIAERLELIRAGYTREEIASFEADPEPAQEQHTDPEPAQEQHTDPEPAQEQHTDPEPDNGNAAVLAAIANLTKAIQLSNLKSTNVGPDNKLTPEKALAIGVFGNKE